MEKAPYLSEEARDAEMDLLRTVEAEMGVADVVAPKPGPINAPVVTPVVDPGPVAEPVPANAQPPVPTSPEVAGAAPEATNAFSGTDPGAST